MNRAVGSATIPLPVTPKIPSGSKVAWENIAGASVAKVIPLPVQPTISPAAKAEFAGEAKGLRGLLLGGGQFAASRALGIGAVAAGLFVFGKGAIAAVKSAATLEQELNVFQQVSGATADQMARVREEARKLGADISLPAVSAGDAATTMTELAKAGLSVNDVLAGTKGTLQLAAAAQIDFAAATQLSANALNAFQLPGSQAVKVADLLAGAANAAQGDISDFGNALTQSAAVAHQAGISIDQTVTFLTELAKAGISGSDAGTSLRVALLRLIAPTKEAKDIFQALGIQITDAAGNVRVDVFEQLRRSMLRLDPATKNAALATIFGTDAIRAAAIFTREGSRGFDQLEKQVTRQGQAAETAAARTKGLSGSVSALSSNIQTLGSDLGTIALPALTALSQALSGAVSDIDATVVAFEKLAKVKVGPFKFDQPLIPGGRGFAKRVLGFSGADLVKSITGIFSDGKKAVQAAPKVGVAGTDAFGLKGFLTGTLADPELEKAMAAAGRKSGAAFARAAGTEITKQERTVIDAAKKTVRDAQAALKTVVAEGARAIEASAVEAKQSLTSIGQSLASSVVTLLDTGTLAQRITDLTTIQDRLTRSRDALQASLDRQQKALQRGNLQKDLRDARDALARAEEQVAGPQTAEERAGANRFLRPLRDNVKDAQKAISEFDQQARIDKVTARINALGLKIGGLGDRLDAQKTRIQRALNDIVAKFNAGLLTGPQVNAQVAALLQKNVGPMAKAGRAQGFAFRQAFTAQLEALQAQIAAILGGPRTRKTGAEPSIVKPTDAVKTAAANTAAAQRSVRDAMQAVAKAQKDATTAVTGSDGTNAILKDIRRELRGSPSKPSADVKTPGKPRVKTGGR